MAVRVIGEKAINAVAETLVVGADEINPYSKNLMTWFKEREREEITDLLAEKVPCAPVLTDDELVNDPNVRKREMIVERRHPLGFMYRTVATGINFSETPTTIDLLPPALGADTVEVLQRLGYDDEEIERFIREGIVSAVGA